MSELIEWLLAEPTGVNAQPSPTKRILPVFPIQPLLEGVTGTGNMQVPTLLAFSPESITGNHPACEFRQIELYSSMHIDHFKPKHWLGFSTSHYDDLEEPAYVSAYVALLCHYEPVRWLEVAHYKSGGTGDHVSTNIAALAVLANPAERLRELTSLSVQQLADIFGITRGAFNNWLSGSSPRGDRESHLLETLKFVEAAAAQFKTTPTLRQWLLTPVAPGAETPFELMKQRRWRALQGLLVQERSLSSSPLPPEPLSGTVRQLSTIELRREAERLSPSLSHEDLDESDARTSGEP